ncbi:MAG: ABC transporter permease [Lachnospiraceae bacterium]|nr:ABC transporter permease [Lachnospiraceae bacterium]MBQ9695711.1 ABC transporter permease [Oscillospiraceae bacterium]MBR1458720.1 ABC transporter permease [Oscillospiraceae bacterium]
MGAIYRREVGAFFSSSIAYVFLGVFFTICGFFFTIDNLGAGSVNLAGVFSTMFIISIVLIPVLTMRLFSEEKKQKTEQGLLTAPVSLTGIVLGKYFAALTVYLIAISIAFVYGVILALFGTVAWLTLLSNYLAILLVGGAFIAVGLFISSLTENQVAAAIGGVVCLLAFFLVDTLASRVNVGWIQSVLYDLSFYTRYYEFTCGIFNLSSVLFFVSVAVLFNFFTVRVFEKRRWS